MIKVITFNILSSMTISPEWYPEIELKYLEQDYRIELLKNILLQYMKQDYILCLQEMSSKDGKKFKSFFESNGYNFIHAPFHAKGLSRLGVAICFPITSAYTLQETHTHRIGEVIEKYLPDNSNEEINDAKFNISLLLLLKFTINKKIFYVATYHMPCKFTKQILMESHVLFCTKVINDIVGNSPIIFAGDFNSKFGENTWKILALGEISNNISKSIVEQYPECLNHFTDSLIKVKDREFTCYDQKDKTVYNIDFIFYRNLQCVTSSVVTRDIPIPSKDYPSDHLPIISSFNLL
jgi:mRNA deadenylase 3'-5' endonuclease subunit Ccr4